MGFKIERRRIIKARLLSVFTKRLRKLKADWKVYSGDRAIPCNAPAKIIGAKLPAIPQLTGRLPVHLSRSSYIAYGASTPVASMTIEEFLSYQGDLKLSIVQHDLPQHETPPLVQLNMPHLYKANLWYYRGQRLTNWHYDGHDNFLFQLEGSKTVWLSPLGSMRCRSLFSLNSNQSVQRSARKRFHVTIHKGQCLFIPRGWMHRVLSHHTSIAVNYWGNSIIEQIERHEYDLVLRYVVGELAERETTRMVKRITKSNEMGERRRKILQLPFNELREKMFEHPIDFEFLREKLDTGSSTDKTQVWQRISYRRFVEQLQNTRRNMFASFLKKLD